MGDEKAAPTAISVGGFDTRFVVHQQSQQVAANVVAGGYVVPGAVLGGSGFDLLGRHLRARLVPLVRDQGGVSTVSRSPPASSAACWRATDSAASTVSSRSVRSW